MKRVYVLFAALCMICFAGCYSPSVQETKPPKYVFLFIGDGMGKPHVDLARQLCGPLNMDKLPVRGSVSTINADKRITDSAASGTAFACGVKTKSGRLGIDAKGNSVESCAVAAKKQGRMVAILTTVGVNNATPAAFYAHVMKRSESKKIMDQFPDSGIDILCGSEIDGMRKNVKQEDFLPGKAYLHGPVQGNAEGLDKKGITVLANGAKFLALKRLTNPVLVYSWHVTNDPAVYVKKSIELMQGHPQGFFMMTEGGRIDYGGHGNNGQSMLFELKNFDLALAEALNFYEKHPSETLIVVSADHHTGGLELTGKAQKEYRDQTYEKMKISEKDSAEAIREKLSKNGISTTAAEQAELDKTVKAEPKKRKGLLSSLIRRIVDARSGIRWKTRNHTADEVYLFAIGSGSDKFAGKQENSDVGRKLKEIFQSK